MTDESAYDGASLSLPALERTDRVCLELEAVWRAGQAPRIEDYLGEAQGAERNQLPRGPLPPESITIFRSPASCLR